MLSFSVLKYINVLITANLSYKMPKISEKDKINVILKNIFHF